MGLEVVHNGSREFSEHVDSNRDTEQRAIGPRTGRIIWRKRGPEGGPGSLFVEVVSNPGKVGDPVPSPLPATCTRP